MEASGLAKCMNHRGVSKKVSENRDIGSEIYLLIELRQLETMGIEVWRGTGWTGLL